VPLPNPNDPYAVAEYLDAVLRLVDEALDVAVQRARETFGWWGKDQVDAYLGPGIVRFHAKSSLREAGQTVHEITHQDLANNGLHLLLDEFEIRILKASQGEPPTPGYSRRKRQYFRQLELPLLDTEAVAGFSQRVRLLALWDVGPRFTYAGLILAAPKWGGITRDSVATHWSIPLADRVGRVSAASFNDEIPLGDLDIELDLGQDDREQDDQDTEQAG
jgi:hypothetical protein